MPPSIARGIVVATMRDLGTISRQLHKVAVLTVFAVDEAARRPEERERGACIASRAGRGAADKYAAEKAETGTCGHHFARGFRD